MLYDLYLVMITKQNFDRVRLLNHEKKINKILYSIVQSNECYEQMFATFSLVKSFFFNFNSFKEDYYMNITNFIKIVSQQLDLVTFSIVHYRNSEALYEIK